MRALLDACVLYPTVMREVLLGVARAGLFEPMWSPRILEEWARAARKLGPEGEAQARGEVALLQAAWPRAEVVVQEGTLARLWLPDPDDVHVLGAAIAGSADAIVTLNIKDFPKNILAEEGLARWTPDELLMAFHAKTPDVLEHVVSDVQQQAERLSGQAWPARALLKKARLPRLGKAVAPVLG